MPIEDKKYASKFKTIINDNHPCDIFIFSFFHLSNLKRLFNNLSNLGKVTSENLKVIPTVDEDITCKRKCQS